MRATIDKAGRLVIPKPLRDRLGLRPGEVELTADGIALRVEPVSAEGIAEQSGRQNVEPTGSWHAGLRGGHRRCDQRQLSALTVAEPQVGVLLADGKRQEPRRAFLEDLP